MEDEKWRIQDTSQQIEAAVERFIEILKFLKNQIYNINTR